MNVIVNDRTHLGQLGVVLAIMVAMSVGLLRWAKQQGMVVAASRSRDEGRGAKSAPSDRSRAPDFDLVPSRARASAGCWNPSRTVV
jgi:hypothetical protein